MYYILLSYLKAEFDPTAYILMKKMSSIYNGWAVLFENLNGMGVPLNHSFQYLGTAHF